MQYRSFVVKYLTSLIFWHNVHNFNQARIHCFCALYSVIIHWYSSSRHCSKQIWDCLRWVVELTDIIRFRAALSVFASQGCICVFLNRDCRRSLFTKTKDRSVTATPETEPGVAPSTKDLKLHLYQHGCLPLAIFLFWPVNLWRTYSRHRKEDGLS